MTRKMKKVLKIVCIFLAGALVVGGIVALRKNKDSGSGIVLSSPEVITSFDDFALGESSASRLYTSQISLASGSSNAVSWVYDGPAAGMYKLSMKLNNGTSASTPVVLQNVTTDANSNAFCSWIDQNTEGLDDTGLFSGYSDYALYVNMAKGENTLQLYSTAGNLDITAIKLTRVTNGATLALVAANSTAQATTNTTYTASATLTHSGSYGYKSGTNNYILLGSDEKSDKVAHTFTVSKSGSYDLGILAAGVGDARILITDSNGTTIYDGSVAEPNAKADCTIGSGRSGDTALIDTGKTVSLRTGMTYTCEITTTNWVTYGGLCLSIH